MTSHKSAVCTLFEGHYHHGFAALVNSLYKNGFRGAMYIGYRGELPAWIKNVNGNGNSDWEGAFTMTAANGLQLHFLPVKTEWHLANYKPVFMLAVQRLANANMFYFDPDITIKCNWKFFEEWIGYGVAVVQEAVSNNFSPNHPKRIQYLPVIEQTKRKVERSLHHILNSGFCGVSVKNVEFLKAWIDIANTAVQHFDFEPSYFIKGKQQYELFVAGDQDLMNMAAMCTQSPISDVGPEGMDFIPGGWLMSHATGAPKPWKKNYLLAAAQCFPPTIAERNYWMNANGIIKTHPSFTIWRKQLCIKCASFIGRFYKRS